MKPHLSGFHVTIVIALVFRARKRIQSLLNFSQEFGPRIKFTF
jgi:hypothetical protein